MAKFSFRKQKTEDDADLPELLEGEDSALLDDDDGDEGGGRTRRLLLILGLVVIIAGGGYLAWNLFMEQPPPPPPPRPIAMPPAKPPAPRPPAPAAPAPAPAPPAKAEAKAPMPEPAKTPEKPQPPPAAASKVKPPAEAKTAKAPAKSAPPTASKAAQIPSASSYSLQVGAMVMQENAQNLKRRLDEAGFQASVRNGTAYLTKHVVLAGDFASKRDAEELMRRLSVDGFPSQLLAEGGKYAPQVASFFNLDEAIDLARELQKKNHHPKIASKSANTTVFQVRHGSFDSRAAAVKRGEELRAKGFNVLVVRN